MWGQKENVTSTETVKPRTGQPVSLPEIAQPPGLSTAIKPDEDDGRSGRDQEQLSRIFTDTKIKGEVVGVRDIYVDGVIEGVVEVPDNALIIGPNGIVRAQVKARTLTLWGHLEGNVQTVEKIEIRKTGSLIGDLETAQIVIEDGAMFRGSIDILKPGMKEKAPPAAAAESGSPTVSTDG